VANIIVMLNGITLDAADFTATSGTSVVLGTGATTSDELVVVAFKSFTVADHYTQAQADALLGAKAPLASPVFTGNVGVGTSNASIKLEANIGTTGGLPATSGSTQPNASLRVAGSNTGTALDFGVDGATTAASWIQASSQSNHATNWALLLNPNGGNVGIGTTSPTGNTGTSLVVHHSSAPRIRLTNDTTGQAVGDGGEITMGGSDLVVENRESSGNARFYTGGAERLRINSTGKIMVNDVSQTYKKTAAYLHSAGNTDLSNGTVPLELCVAGTSSGTRYLASFANVNGVVGSITVAGSSTTYNTGSDYRLKEDDVAMTGAVDRVKALRPINFAWKVDGSRVDGFFAHELAEVVPEAVTGSKDAMYDEEYEATAAALDDEGNETTPAVMATRSVPNMQGVDQSKIVPLLTAALQEAIAKIESLETRLTALEV